ncbi:MAG: A/G-specific adenine glycosylase [Patescibacteria group bacterium]
MSSFRYSKFQRHILDWYRKNNRDYLPWRFTKKKPVSPYEIFVSEIMLQQTQVGRVLEKYPKFLKAFPTIQHLARAPLPKLLRVWQGMGYNRRARYLKEAAEIMVKDYKGVVPSDLAILRRLPGVGPYTVGAIACFAYNKPVVFLDTNIRKVFLHHFLMSLRGSDPATAGERRGNLTITKDRHASLLFLRDDNKIDDSQILAIAEKTLDRKNPRRWHYALMDYGAVMLNNKPELLRQAKIYHKQSRFEGSTRYWRSQIVKYLLRYGQVSGEELQALVSCDIHPPLSSLVRDGLVEASSPGLYHIAR